jgi:anti-sigma factor RsiW
MTQLLSCSITEKLLHPYIDGALSMPERQAVERHVAGCRSCRQAFVTLERTVLALESLPRVAAPAGLLAATMASVRAVHREEPAVRRWEPVATFALVMLTFVSVIAAAVAGGAPLLAVLDAALDDPAMLLENLAVLSSDAELPLLVVSSALLVGGAMAFAQLLRGEFTARPAGQT